MLATAHDYSWLPSPPPRQYRLLPGEVAVYRAKAELTPSEWAQGERYVAVSPMPGPYDGDVTPYQTGLLDLFALEMVRELFVAGGSQSAKTDLMHTCWGYVAVHDPGPALLVMQDRDTGAEMVADRIEPMINNTPSLRRLRTGNQDDVSSRRIRLRNGMTTHLGWAQSEGRLASKPVRYGLFDEVDLWPDSAVRKARARLRAFEDSYKVIEACTVSTEQGRIWQAQKLAQLLIDFWPVCPYCQEAQRMDFASVRWGDGIMDPALLAEKGSAWYVCPHCEAKWDEEDRNEAVLLGAAVHDMPRVWHGWRPRDGEFPRHFARVWAHIEPMLSRFVPFNKVAAAYLTTLVEGTQANLQYFYNDCRGLPIPEDAEGELTSEQELYKRRCEYAPDGAAWQIPMLAVVITADADVQANRIEVEVVAWGDGHQSWGVEYKTFFGDTSKDQVWDQLHEWAQDASWPHESGATLAIIRLGVDLGYRTDQVSKFVKRSRRYLAHKGSNTRGLPLVPRRPSKSRRYKVPFYELGVDTGKDTLFSWLTVTEPGPRCCHWHKGYDFEYFRMLCAEKPKREKNRKTGKMEVSWALREGIVRNEALDIRVGNMAVREILNPNYAKLAAALAAAMDKPKEIDGQAPAAPMAKEKKAKSFTSSKGVRLDD